VKRYGSGLRNYTRIITRPVAGTVIVAVNGVTSAQALVNAATGVVTFNPGFLPAAGAVVTAGFQFDVPARFDSDRLEINLTQFGAGEIPHIPIVEVRA
jgi:uncharacterized protein (TIGR02217 family)